MSILSYVYKLKGINIKFLTDALGFVIQIIKWNVKDVLEWCDIGRRRGREAAKDLGVSHHNSDDANIASYHRWSHHACYLHYYDPDTGVSLFLFLPFFMKVLTYFLRRSKGPT